MQILAVITQWPSLWRSGRVGGIVGKCISQGLWVQIPPGAKLLHSIIYSAFTLRYYSWDKGEGWCTEQRERTLLCTVVFLVTEGKYASHSSLLDGVEHSCKLNSILYILCRCVFNI